MYMYTGRVYTVCRGMTVCARCYVMFVSLNKYFLILFEHPNTDRAVTCALSRAKSEKAGGCACPCAASKLTFTYTVELLWSLSCDQEMALMGAAVSGMFGRTRDSATAAPKRT